MEHRVEWEWNTEWSGNGRGIVWQYSWSRLARGRSCLPSSSSCSCCSSTASVLHTCPLVLAGMEEGPPPSSTGRWRREGRERGLCEPHIPPRGCPRWRHTRGHMRLIHVTHWWVVAMHSTVRSMAHTVFMTTNKPPNTTKGLGGSVVWSLLGIEAGGRCCHLHTCSLKPR